jgi:hypothetical protein
MQMSLLECDNNELFWKYDVLSLDFTYQRLDLKYIVYEDSK